MKFNCCTQGCKEQGATLLQALPDPEEQLDAAWLAAG